MEYFGALVLLFFYIKGSEYFFYHCASLSQSYSVNLMVFTYFWDCVREVMVSLNGIFWCCGLSRTIPPDFSRMRTGGFGSGSHPGACHLLPGLLQPSLCRSPRFCHQTSAANLECCYIKTHLFILHINNPY